MFGFWIAFLTLSAYVTGRVISSSEFILLVGDCGKEFTRRLVWKSFS